MNAQDWSRLGWIGWISLQSKGLSRVFSNTTVQKHQFFSAQLSLWSSHPYMTTGKIMALTRWTFISKVMSLLFNMLSRFVIFSSKKQASFNFMAAVTVLSDCGAQENKVCHCFHCLPIYFPWSDGTGCHDLRFLNVEFYASFCSLLFHFHQEVFKFLFSFCHKGGVICISEVIDISRNIV